MPMMRMRFPLRFQIIAGTEHDVEGKVIASFSEQDAVMPRIAPLCIPCPGTRASWIKLEATRLGSVVGRTYVLQLAEMMVFSGQENIALGCPLKTHPVMTTITKGPDKPLSLLMAALPYLMHSPGKKTTAYFTRVARRAHSQLYCRSGWRFSSESPAHAQHGCQ